MDVGQADPTTTFLDPRDKLWSLYLNDAEKRDKERVEHWKGSTDGILIFTGLFAATVASFVIYTLPMLVPDTGNQTVLLLSYMLVVLTHNETSPALPTVLPYDLKDLDNGLPQRAAAVINVLLIMSLFLALACALASTLVQQWGRSYIHDSSMHATIGKRGLVHAGLEDGIEKSMNGTIAMILTVLHTAVLLFFLGLIVLVYTTPHIHTKIILSSLMGIGVIIYVALSLCPLFSHISPFHTPFSWIFTFYHVSYCNLRLLFRSGLELPHVVVLLHPCMQVLRLFRSGLEGILHRHGHHGANWFDKPRLAMGIFWQFVTNSKAWTVNKRSACLEESLERVPNHKQTIWIGSALSRLMRSADELEDAVSLWEAFVPFISSPQSSSDREIARTLRSYAASDKHDLKLFWHRIKLMVLSLDSNKDSDAYFSRAVIACCTVTRHLLDIGDNQADKEMISPESQSLITKVSCYAPFDAQDPESRSICRARSNGALLFLNAELRIAVHNLALRNDSWLDCLVYRTQYDSLWLRMHVDEQLDTFEAITPTMVRIQLVLNFIDLFRNILIWIEIMGLPVILETLKETSWIPLVARAHVQAMTSAHDESVASSFIEQAYQSSRPRHDSVLMQLLSELGVTDYQALESGKRLEGDGLVKPTFSTVDPRYRPLFQAHPKLARMVHSLYALILDGQDVAYSLRSVSRLNTARSSMITVEQSRYGRSLPVGAMPPFIGGFRTSIDESAVLDFTTRGPRHVSSASAGHSNTPHVPMIRVALPDPVPVSDAIPVPYMPFNQAPDTASIPIGHAQTIHDAPLQNTATSLMNGSMGDTSHSDKASGTKPKTRGLMRRSRVQKPRDQSTTYTGSDGDSVAHTEPTEGGGIAREVSVADNNEPHVQGRSRESVKVESVVEAMALSADMHAPMVRQESSDSSVTVVERDDVGATSRYAKLDEESHLLRESIGLLGAYWQENSENIV